MPDLDRVTAGLSCREVLADLSELLDGGLAPDRVAAIHAHLSACDTCARFGGSVTEIVSALRTQRERGPVMAPGDLEVLRARVQQSIATATSSTADDEA